MSIRPRRTSGCMAGKGWRPASQAITPPSFISALAVRMPLAVFVVDEGQPALVERKGLVHVALAVRLDDGANAVGEGAARHGTRGARIQVGQQGDGFFAVPRAFDGVSTQADQLAP